MPVQSLAESGWVLWGTRECKLLALNLPKPCPYCALVASGIMNMFCIGLVLAGILQAVMWLPANGNLPTSFVFALLYGATGVGAIGVQYALLIIFVAQC